RGDIGSTAAQYAAHLGGVPDVPEWDDAFGAAPEDPWHEDAITVNPYLGADGIMPFVDVADATDKDVFVLVRTSNPSSSQLQTVVTAAGAADAADIAGTRQGSGAGNSSATVSDLVADLVEQWGKPTRGAHGYSRVGAVVGATHPAEGAALRARMPHTFFLVPGYGAQGGTAADVAHMFDANGSGAIVNSSRGIIAAWKKDPQASRFDADAFETPRDMAQSEAIHDDAAAALELVGACAAHAAETMRDAITDALNHR
ncbi:MAG: orotidine-5'-phosphate decarboxylase, partial [Bifidobacteriaceae bacterium]|nr:orotidine-5'-phosphate decarboxylase [Bifidobacteriaceae bacterium]